MPCWPGSAGFRLVQTHSIAGGDHANGSRLECDLHVGTHVDAPWHFIEDGKTVEQISLDVLVGPAYVVHYPEASAITADLLSQSQIPAGTERLLFRTKNEGLMQCTRGKFVEDFVALTSDAAQWLVDHDLRLVGIDYLSVQRFADGPETHQILLGQQVVLVEGLNLANIQPGPYDLICLPMKIAGAEAAPARVLLRSDT